jgi:Flp pilus assembly protein TadG
MRMPIRLRRLGRSEKGATLVEFAFILPALCVLLLGIFELGYRSYAASVIQGALHEAARMAAVGGVSMTQIDARVRERLNTFSNHGTVATQTSSYLDFAGVQQAERITSDTVPTGSFNPGDCFEDANGNSTYDLDRGQSGTGNADDVVRYQVTFTYTRLFPIGSFIGWSNTETITSSTVLRNQPFAGRSTTRPIICTPPTP